MKIGTITFHWATNYGAVLQAYALQYCLKQNGYSTEVINYVPLKVKILMVLSNLKDLNYYNVIKEYRIKKFRRDHLNISDSIYLNSASLNNGCHEYDCYICGSDQIWNESFIKFSERKPNLSYYLSFVKEEKQRISYATSFGTEKLSSFVANLIKPELEKFSNISVRETTGKRIINDLGFDSFLVADPTILLQAHDYENLINSSKTKNHYQLFSYILHKNQRVAGKVNDYIFNNYFDVDKERKYNNEPIGIIEWLFNIRNSRLVLTNSFHGVVFSVIFNKQFIVVPVENSKMNDRIYTFLRMLGLEERIIVDYDEVKINGLMEKEIDWEPVNNHLEEFREKSIKYLLNALEV